jgi:hypothetical protein
MRETINPIFCCNLNSNFAFSIDPIKVVIKENTIRIENKIREFCPINLSMLSGVKTPRSQMVSKLKMIIYKIKFNTVEITFSRLYLPDAIKYVRLEENPKPIIRVVSELADKRIVNNPLPSEPNNLVVMIDITNEIA